MEQELSISESEWRVMKIVWGNSPQTPVSYTHLDVYKRQEPSTHRVRMRNCWKPALSTGICGRRISERKTRCKGCLLYTSRCV